MAFGDEEGYNGYINYETWNVALWIDNEYAIYQDYQRRFAHTPATEKTLEALVRKWFPDGTPDFDDMGREEAYNRVDWAEIVENINEDLHPDGVCESCGESMEKDCMGQPRCDVCDDPCPHCSDGDGFGADDESDEDEEGEAL